MWSDRNYTLLTGTQSGTATLEDSLMVSYKTNHTLTIKPSKHSLVFIRRSWRLISTQKPAHEWLKVKWKSLSHSQLFCNPMGCSLPGYSVHGIFQASLLEWVAIFSVRGSSQPRARTHVSMSPALQADSLPRVRERRISTCNNSIQMYCSTY